MGSCLICGKEGRRISSFLGLCLECIRERFDKCISVVEEAHGRARERFGLPKSPPRSPDGRRCGLCARDCVIGEGEVGYCGRKEVKGGRLVHMAGVPERGLLHWYRDPLPTNCVADWVCIGHGMRGYHNLAVFYKSCSLDCLFCQNWHFREISSEDRLISAQELSDLANDRTFCVCYFGGDPSSQMPHAIASARRLAEKGVVICWETSGQMNERLMEKAVELSLATGGTVKFDIKAYDWRIHMALTGSSNEATLRNFEMAAKRFRERSSPPLVVASTLLVPGYVDAEEVYRIASFISSIDERIPYSLLAFAPHFLMGDLPRTSRREAFEARDAAIRAGLRNVHIGNIHLLS
jgi:pyruvate formate lyase activating enzyme